VTKDVSLEELEPEKAQELAIELGYANPSAYYAKMGLEALRKGRKLTTRGMNVIRYLSERMGLTRSEILNADPKLIEVILNELKRGGYSERTIYKWKKRLLKAIGEDPSDWVYVQGRLIKIPKPSGFCRESHRFHEIPPRGPERAQVCEIEG